MIKFILICIIVYATVRAIRHQRKLWQVIRFKQNLRAMEVRWAIDEVMMIGATEDRSKP